MSNTDKALSFREWCELNGRTWPSVTERSFLYYEAYCEQWAKDHPIQEPECT